MKYSRLNVQIEVEAPLLTRGNDVLPVGIDAEMLRYQGVPVFPATSIRGNLWHAWNEFNAISPGTIPLGEWLGTPTANALDADQEKKGNGKWTPNRGQLLFSHHFQISGSDISSNTQIRIELGDVGVVESGAFQIVDACGATGSTLVLSGWIDFPPGVDASKLQEAVERGLIWSGSLGSMKGSGYGRIVSINASIEPINTGFAPRFVQTNSGISSGPVVQADYWTLTFGLDRPFCFTDPSASVSNKFTSVPYVPGASIVAQIAAASGLDSQTIDRISVTHATLDRGLLAPPYSWICKSNKKSDAEQPIADMADYAAPVLFTRNNEYLEPSFVDSWNFHHLALSGLLGSRPPDPGWLEVRNAIAKESRRVEDEQLFNLLCVDPHETSNKWVANICVKNLSISEREILATFFLEEFYGPFGKTDALVTTATLESSSAAKWQEKDGRFRVLLTSDANLLDSDSVDPWDTFAAYAKYWSSLTNHTLELTHCYAQEMLAGGTYIHQRFETGMPYQPDVLTKAGSVFVLKSKNAAEGAELLTQLSMTNLTDSHRYRSQPFNKRPWSPGNGFGSIRPLPDLGATHLNGWEIENV